VNARSSSERAKELIAIADLRDAGPGGICEECGHFACRHQDSQCLFPRENNPCECQGMLWQGVRLDMDQHTGPRDGIVL
jgi:hypothetical protein